MVNKLPGGTIHKLPADLKKSVVSNPKVKKLWEDRKSKWESVKGNLKNKEYDVAISELQAIEKNLEDAIKLKTDYLNSLKK